MPCNKPVAADHDAPPITQILAAKLKALSDPIIGRDKIASLIAAAWKISEAADVRALTAIAQP